MTAAPEPLRPAAWTSRYIDVAGLGLHLLDYGTAGKPAMLCLHGGAAHGHWFDFVAGRFAEHHHVLALDQRGHGRSAWADPPEYGYRRYADDLAEAVEVLGLTDFVLVGHSMGGMVSLVYAATHPGRLGRLVVIDSTMQMTEERVAGLRDIGNRDGRSYATHDEFLAGFRLRPAGTRAAPEVIAHLARQSGREREDGRFTHRFDRNVYGRREAIDSYPYWARIAVPVLLVKGGLSGRITPEVAARVRAHCPQVEIEEVAGADHHVTLDNPGDCARVVLAFLARTAGRRATARG